MQRAAGMDCAERTGWKGRRRHQPVFRSDLAGEHCSQEPTVAAAAILAAAAAVAAAEASGIMAVAAPAAVGAIFKGPTRDPCARHNVPIGERRPGAAAGACKGVLKYSLDAAYPPGRSTGFPRGELEGHHDPEEHVGSEGAAAPHDVAWRAKESRIKDGVGGGVTEPVPCAQSGQQRGPHNKRWGQFDREHGSQGLAAMTEDGGACQDQPVKRRRLLTREVRGLGLEEEVVAQLWGIGARETRQVGSRLSKRQRATGFTKSLGMQKEAAPVEDVGKERSTDSSASFEALVRAASVIESLGTMKESPAMGPAANEYDQGCVGSLGKRKVEELSDQGAGSVKEAATLSSSGVEPVGLEARRPPLLFDLNVTDEEALAEDVDELMDEDAPRLIHPEEPSTQSLASTSEGSCVPGLQCGKQCPPPQQQQQQKQVESAPRASDYPLVLPALGGLANGNWHPPQASPGPSVPPPPNLNVHIPPSNDNSTHCSQDPTTSPTRPRLEQPHFAAEVPVASLCKGSTQPSKQAQPAVAPPALSPKRLLLFDLNEGLTPNTGDPDAPPSSCSLASPSPPSALCFSQATPSPTLSASSASPSSPSSSGAASQLPWFLKIPPPHLVVRTQPHTPSKAPSTAVLIPTATSQPDRRPTGLSTAPLPLPAVVPFPMPPALAYHFLSSSPAAAALSLAPPMATTSICQPTAAAPTTSTYHATAVAPTTSTYQPTSSAPCSAALSSALTSAAFCGRPLAAPSITSIPPTAAMLPFPPVPWPLPGAGFFTAPPPSRPATSSAKPSSGLNGDLQLAPGVPVPGAGVLLPHALVLPFAPVAKAEPGGSLPGGVARISPTSQPGASGRQLLPGSVAAEEHLGSLEGNSWHVDNLRKSLAQLGLPFPMRPVMFPLPPAGVPGLGPPLAGKASPSAVGSGTSPLGTGCSSPLAATGSGTLVSKPTFSGADHALQRLLEASQKLPKGLDASKAPGPGCGSADKGEMAAPLETALRVELGARSPLGERRAGEPKADNNSLKQTAGSKSLHALNGGCLPNRVLGPQVRPVRLLGTAPPSNPVSVIPPGTAPPVGTLQSYGRHVGPAQFLSGPAGPVPDHGGVAGPVPNHSAAVRPVGNRNGGSAVSVAGPKGMPPRNAAEGEEASRAVNGVKQEPIATTDELLARLLAAKLGKRTLSFEAMQLPTSAVGRNPWAEVNVVEACRNQFRLKDDAVSQQISVDAYRRGLHYIPPPSFTQGLPGEVVRLPGLSSDLHLHRK